MSLISKVWEQRLWKKFVTTDVGPRSVVPEVVVRALLRLPQSLS